MPWKRRSMSDDPIAIRHWKGDRATITVTMPDGREMHAGGKRAHRAQAVILARWSAGDETTLYGCRGNLADAQSEAQRLRSATTRRIRGVDYPITPWLEAYVVQVTEEERT
jgi:hypothetical protein